MNAGGFSRSKKIFKIVDCRGYEISCSEENWYGKIVGARPTLGNRIDDIINTLQNPHFICEDSKKKNRHVYYLIELLGQNRYLKVVVHFSRQMKGQVISVFLTDSGKEGERIIWTRSNG